MKNRVHKARPKIGGRLSDERKSIALYSRNPEGHQIMRKWDKAHVNKIQRLLWDKQDEMNPPDCNGRQASFKSKPVIERWETYMKENGFLVRKSRECFYTGDGVIVFGYFRIRRTWKIGVPYELADRILILGTLP